MAIHSDDFVNDDNECSKGEKEDEPPSEVVDIEGNKEDKATKGDMPKYPPPYPRRLIKKRDNQFKKFIKMVNKGCLSR